VYDVAELKKNISKVEASSNMLTTTAKLNIQQLKKVSPTNSEILSAVQHQQGLLVCLTCFSLLVLIPSKAAHGIAI